MSYLTIKKLADGATIPTRATSGSAGYDLYAYDSGEIKARTHEIVDTKITMFIPKNHCGLIWPRSGFSAKHGIETGAGVIDSDYTGEIKVILHNHSDMVFKYEQGMRIAQILIQPVATPELKEITKKEVEISLNELCHSICTSNLNTNATDSDSSSGDESNMPEPLNMRNDKGFGSSGLF